eukprot:CAMPEP_0115013984 /NCGR_PEP_ID=MMETSP0216-20121206/25767_1 /TAXON_ID=223996 /ORGANISM="Protocruzia adherens, Strain Boccale" /LENGTH=1094 /DNA_ID=CAMNT_0002383555 /DNA_START=153 /DNA_END=3437 /DNA_ORIENTATION=+
MMSARRSKSRKVTSPSTSIKAEKKENANVVNNIKNYNNFNIIIANRMGASGSQTSLHPKSHSKDFSATTKGNRSSNNSLSSATPNGAAGGKHRKSQSSASAQNILKTKAAYGRGAQLVVSPKLTTGELRLSDGATTRKMKVKGKTNSTKNQSPGMFARMSTPMEYYRPQMSESPKHRENLKRLQSEAINSYRNSEHTLHKTPTTKNSLVAGTRQEGYDCHQSTRSSLNNMGQSLDNSGSTKLVLSGSTDFTDQGTPLSYVKPGAQAGSRKVTRRSGSQRSDGDERSPSTSEVGIVPSNRNNQIAGIDKKEFHRYKYNNFLMARPEKVPGSRKSQTLTTPRGSGEGQSSSRTQRSTNASNSGVKTSSIKGRNHIDSKPSSLKNDLRLSQMGSSHGGAKNRHSGSLSTKSSSSNKLRIMPSPTLTSAKVGTVSSTKSQTSRDRFAFQEFLGMQPYMGSEVEKSGKSHKRVMSQPYLGNRGGDGMLAQQIPNFGSLVKNASMTSLTGNTTPLNSNRKMGKRSQNSTKDSTEMLSGRASHTPHSGRRMEREPGKIVGRNTNNRHLRTRSETLDYLKGTKQPVSGVASGRQPSSLQNSNIDGTTKRSCESSLTNNESQTSGKLNRHSPKRSQQSRRQLSQPDLHKLRDLDSLEDFNVKINLEEIRRTNVGSRASSRRQAADGYTERGTEALLYSSGRFGSQETLSSNPSNVREAGYNDRAPKNLRLDVGKYRDQAVRGANRAEKIQSGQVFHQRRKTGDVIQGPYGGRAQRDDRIISPTNMTPKESSLSEEPQARMIRHDKHRKSQEDLHKLARVEELGIALKAKEKTTTTEAIAETPKTDICTPRSGMQRSRASTDSRKQEFNIQSEQFDVESSAKQEIPVSTDRNGDSGEQKGEVKEFGDLLSEKLNKLAFDQGIENEAIEMLEPKMDAKTSERVKTDTQPGEHLDTVKSKKRLNSLASSGEGSEIVLDIQTEESSSEMGSTTLHHYRMLYGYSSDESEYDDLSEIFEPMSPITIKKNTFFMYDNSSMKKDRFQYTTTSRVEDTEESEAGSDYQPSFRNFMFVGDSHLGERPKTIYDDSFTGVVKHLHVHYQGPKQI